MYVKLTVCIRHSSENLEGRQDMKPGIERRSMLKWSSRNRMSSSPSSEYSSTASSCEHSTRNGTSKSMRDREFLDKLRRLSTFKENYTKKLAAYLVSLFLIIIIIIIIIIIADRLCGLVVRVHRYRSRGQDSIPGATKFCEK
jgi:hypothetical protein